MQSTLKLILVRCLSSLHVKLVYLIKTSSGDYSYNKKDHAKAYLAILMCIESFKSTHVGDQSSQEVQILRANTCAWSRTNLSNSKITV
jgi:hypothetical protein